MFKAASGSYVLLSSDKMTSNRWRIAVQMVIPSYVASARPRQLRGPAFQEWYSIHRSVRNSFEGEKISCLFPGWAFQLTERTVGDALPVLFEPSVRVEDASVFSPDLRHSSEDIVLVADNVASVLLLTAVNSICL
jgi:hypothetical protein